ncbi:hypothetical protein [Lactobacillus taiwanensis]|uniref:hypothetical protein n=1 Tax=Lactobacillus taiwanensis TaxID=508451 RepID=UPI0025AF7AEE|nr:hypothetical protein [Lactobacillus taiwanensis]
MVDILNNHTSNQEFLDFAVNPIHNVDIVTTHQGEPSAQVCDLLLNKNGKLYIATSSQNPFFQDLINQPKVIINGYKGMARWILVAFQLEEQLIITNT